MFRRTGVEQLIQEVYLQDSRVGNHWVALGLAVLAAAKLNGLDNTVRLNVTWDDFAKDNVLAVEPVGHDGGNEELRAIAA
jgi:hypothetical protein